MTYKRPTSSVDMNDLQRKLREEELRMAARIREVLGPRQEQVERLDRMSGRLP